MPDLRYGIHGTSRPWLRPVGAFYCNVEGVGFFGLNSDGTNPDCDVTSIKTLTQTCDRNYIDREQLDWLKSMLSSTDHQVNFFVHQTPVLGTFHKGMSEYPTETRDYLGMVLGAGHPVVLSADEHNYSRRRWSRDLFADTTSTLYQAFGDKAFYEVKACPAGAPVRNGAMIEPVDETVSAAMGFVNGIRYIEGVEFFRAPEGVGNFKLGRDEQARTGQNGEVQRLEQEEHYYAIFEVNPPQVTVRVYAVVFDVEYSPEPTRTYPGFDTKSLTYRSEMLLDEFPAGTPPPPQEELVKSGASKYPWKYLIPASVDELRDGSGVAWNALGFDDSGWKDACISERESTTTGAVMKTGIGYGDDDDCTPIGQAISVFTRLEFNVDEPAQIAQLILSLDFDDGFVAYINGVKVAHSNIAETLEDWGFNTFANDEHEARGFRAGWDGRSLCRIKIGGETMSLTGCQKRQAPIDYPVDLSRVKLQKGRNILAISGHNASVTSSDFSLIPGLRMQRRQPGALEFARTPNKVRSAWYPVGLKQGFSNPVVLVSMDTFNGWDPAGLRVRKVGGGGFELMVEEEGSGDSETRHTRETVTYLVSEPGTIRDSSGKAIGEVGLVDVGQVDGRAWHEVTLQNSYSVPIVLTNMTTYNGAQPAHIRLRKVTGHSFKFQIEEWDYLDGYHTTESVGYLVLESGVHELADGNTIEADRVKGDHEWQTVSFAAPFTEPPVTLSHCQTYNGYQAVVTRAQAVGAGGFDVALQEEEGNDGRHVKEFIGYVVIGRRQ